VDALAALAVKAHERLVLAGLAADTGTGDDTAARTAELARLEAGVGRRLTGRDDGQLGETVGEMGERVVEVVLWPELARFAAAAETQPRGVDRRDRLES
jgi:hypothetical protein